ncbi:hypothetical protein [Rhodovulum steppense]|uniref:LPS-assembly lipoprotein n=1 Tax=Rhodovulum steppense TaxID=540251 RepID=A0A4R1YKG8_9RHOB|nr:hypothetical protein [Rhodovulum steppense]TCM77343.1 hypothetical protein EV216_13024 [Rhodovulum steppense]
MTGRMGRAVAVLAMATALGGCVQNRAPSGPVPSGIVPVSMGSAHSGMIGAVVQPGGGALPGWAPELSDGTFRAALENALRQAGIMAPGGVRTLEATVLQVDQPPSETSTTKVVLTVHYLLRDVTGRPVLERRVTSGYTATIAQAVQGVDRLRVAREGAMRQNIDVLLREFGSASADAAY